MGNFLYELFHNQIFVAAASSWLIAQIIKTIIYLILNKEIRLERMTGSGGMPSCHSATVCALVTSTCIVCGPGSPELAIAVMFAMVTIYDAMGVRWETGKQAQVLNSMMETFQKMGNKDISPEAKLKELIGHSPLQVLVGGILGIAIALIECLVLWK
ncbi:MAG: divergent PAP2 family protein [Lachnospiraceae bacterium]|jgi:acid phosphatase family membrane protein YuiD|nr:divergent PAP2 family protein [Lachnospiraceae bacterium]